MMKKRIVVAIGSAIAFVLVGASAYAYFSGKGSTENENAVVENEVAIPVVDDAATNIVPNAEDSLGENPVAQENNQKEEATVSDEKSTTAVDVESMPKSTSDLNIIYGGNGSYECTVSGFVESPGEHLEALYIKGKKVRVSTVDTNIAVNTVIKDGHSYTWSSLIPEVRVTTMEPEEDMFNEKSRSSIFASLDPAIQYHCVWSVIPEDVFDVPFVE